MIGLLLEFMTKGDIDENHFMQSQDGQKLMHLLTKNDQGIGLQQAVQEAVRGNTAQMTEMVKNIMQSPDGAALVERINKAIQK